MLDLQGADVVMQKPYSAIERFGFGLIVCLILIAAFLVVGTIDYNALGLP